MTQISQTIVSATEQGIFRLYALDLPPEQVEAFASPDLTHDGGAWLLRDALGATTLNSDFVECFDVSVLGEVGLADYLTQGNGVAEADVAPYADVLAQLSGHVVLVFSTAFGGVEQTLSPRAPLRYIASFKDDRPPVNFKPLPDESAKAPTDAAPKRKTPSDAAMGGRVATVALLVMALLVWVMIKIAS